MKKNYRLLCLSISLGLLFPSILHANDVDSEPITPNAEVEVEEVNQVNEDITVDNLPNQAAIIILNPESEASREIINLFLNNGPKRIMDPSAPRFALVGKDHKFYFGIGGALKGQAAYDIGNPIESPVYFNTSNIPMNNPEGNRQLFHMSVMSSSLFFHFVALPNTKHQIGAYVNFCMATSTGYGFFLQYAYLKWNGFTAGYDFTNFCDPGMSPMTLDTHGPSSIPFVRTTLVKYDYKYRNWTFNLSAENPNISTTTNEYTRMVNQAAPHISSYIQYNWGENNKSSVRASAIMRNIQYRNLVRDKNENEVGWGVQLSGKAIFNPVVTLHFQGAYGKGIANLIQGVNGLGLDLAPRPNDPGKLERVKLWGVCGGLRFNYTPKLFSTHVYSQIHDYAKRYDGGTIEWEDQYKYAQYVANNLFYDYNSMLRLGVEYAWGRKNIMSGKHRCDNRLEAMIQFSF